MAAEDFGRRYPPNPPSVSPRLYAWAARLRRRRSPEGRHHLVARVAGAALADSLRTRRPEGGPLLRHVLARGCAARPGSRIRQILPKTFRRHHGRVDAPLHVRPLDPGAPGRRRPGGKNPGPAARPNRALPVRDGSGPSLWRSRTAGYQPDGGEYRRCPGFVPPAVGAAPAIL